MRNRFRYFAPTARNGVTYAVALTVLLGAIEGWGADLWRWLVEVVGLPLLFVGGGFVFYMAWFWGVATVYRQADLRGWWRAYKIQERPEAVSARRGPAWSDVVRVVLRNQVFGTLPALVVLYGLLVLRGVDLTAAPPAWTTTLWHLAVFVLVEEVVFYAVHRTLHRPTLFRRFHRVHHEFRESVGITTHYVHPVEHWLGNLFPALAGIVLVGAHPVTMLVWVCLAITNAIHTHAGYALPWMSWGVDHDFHHYNVRECYGAIGLLDRLLGTDAKLRERARAASIL